MNRKLLLLLALLLFSYGLSSCSSDDNSPSEGEQTETPELFTKRYNPDQSFYSKILGQEIKYSVLLPQEYLSESTGKYGVVFLLHGWGGNQSSWGPSGLNIQSIADAQTSNGSIRPLIYIMPEGFNSYFCNRYDGKFNYMDMFINELVPLIDKRFRTTTSKTERAVAGFSMGGFGALSIASQHPETFSVSIGLSPSLNTDEQYISLSQDGWNLQWGNNFGGSGQTGTGRLTSYYKSQCPLHFFKDKPSSTFQTVRYYIDCGDDEERLYAGNGAAASLTYTNNNLFRGSETFSVQLRGAYEAIKGLEGYQNENYIEYNVETKLAFPRIIAPFLSDGFRKRNRMKSELLFSYNLQNRPEFHRRVLTAAWRYHWSMSKKKSSFRYDFLDINYVYMPWISATFKKEYLDDVSNRNAILRYNYEDIFILRTGLNYSFSDSKNALRSNIEVGGNLLYAISNLFGEKRNAQNQYTLFKIAYAQYVKGDFDYTRLVKIDTKNTLALHFGLGIAYPYGNSTILPFEKRYFSGGANSVRGWNVRALGPGKFKGKDGRIDFINQTGDMKLDMNMELRTFLFWKFNCAFFVDAGNIWTLKDYKDQPGGQFRFNEFYKQIAVGI